MRNENQVSSTPEPGIRTGWGSGAGWYIAATLLILYLLSIGPEAGLMDRLSIRDDSTIGFVIYSVYYPLIWVHDNTAADDVLEWYVELWT